MEGLASQTPTDFSREAVSERVTSDLERTSGEWITEKVASELERIMHTRSRMAKPALG